MRKGLVILFIISTRILWAQQPHLLMPTGHTDWIYENVFTRDSRFIYTASNDKTVKIWNVQSKKIEKVLYLKSEVKRIIMSPDSVHCLFSLNNGDQTIWNLRTNVAEYTLRVPSGNCERAVYSKDGRYVILCFWGVNAPILVDCNLYNYYILKIPNYKFGSFAAVSFLPPSNKLMILDGDNGKTHFFTTDSGRFDKTLSSTRNYMALDIAKEWLVTIDNSSEINFFDRKRKKLRTHYLPDSSKIITVINNPLKDELAISANTGLFVVRPKEFLTLNGHYSAVVSLAYNLDGNLLATASNDDKIVVYNLADKKILYRLDANAYNHDGNIDYLEGKDAGVMSFSGDGNFLVVRCVNNISKVFNLRTGKLHMELKGYTRSVQGFEFDPLRPQAYAFRTGVSGLSFTNADTNLYLVNPVDNLKIIRIPAHRKNILTQHFSPNGAELQSVGSDSMLKIWDTENGKLIKQYALKKHYYEVLTSPDDSFLLVFESNKFRIYKHGTRKVVRYSDDNEKFSELKFSPNSRYILGKTDSGYQIYDFIQDSVVFYKKKYGSISYSPTGKRLLGIKDSILHLYNGVNYNHLSAMQFYRYNKKDSGNYEFIRTTFNRSESLLATYIDNSDSMVSVWDANNGNILCNILHFPARVVFLGFSKDQKYLITITKNGLTSYWDTLNFRSSKAWNESKMVYLQLPQIDGIEIAEIAEVNFEGNCAVVKEDARYHFYNLETGLKMYSLLIIDSIDFLWMLPNNEYFASKNAMDKLSWYYRGNIYDFDQWDLRYNRPDKVLKALGSKDTALITAYQNAYLKRVKKLGLDTNQIDKNNPAPVIKVQNAKSIAGISHKSKVELNISASDSIAHSGLQSLHIWVNEVPVYGKNGLIIRGENCNQKVEIELSEGFNTIRVYCINELGSKSLAQFVYTTFQPVKLPRQKVYFVGMGVAQFSNAQYNLKYSVKDIRDLASKLRQRYKDTLEIDTLFNCEVNAENLRRIKLKLQKTRVNDKVIIAYSGHGLLDQNYNYFLSTCEVDFEHPEISGLPYEALENLLDSIPARQKLMLIDACHSGEVDKEELVRIKQEADSLGLKGVDVVAYEGNENGLGLKNSFELMQELFVNVSKGTGATIISASGGTQFALEKGDLQNGVFTYSILEAMQSNSSITVSQLKERVGKRVLELTNGMQKPTNRTETISWDWRVW